MSRRNGLLHEIDLKGVLYRFGNFVSRNFNGKTYDRLEIYCNGAAVCGYRFWVGKQQYYWIPLNYDGYREIEKLEDLTAFRQGLEMLQYSDLPPNWWVWKKNGKTVSTQVIRGRIGDFDNLIYCKGEA